MPFGALAARAARADRMLKGRLAGDAWDELALLAGNLRASLRRAARCVLSDSMAAHRHFRRHV